MKQVAALTFEQARDCVLATMCAVQVPSDSEEVALEEIAGRVLAESVYADRDYPPLARSARDGYAIRVSDLPGKLRVTGEIRAGQPPAGEIGLGEASEIMTGAPVPPGADAVLMVEHTQRDNHTVSTERRLEPGENINPQAAEARRGEVLLEPGHVLGFAEAGLLATVGKTRVHVFRKPRVAILATGDELVAAADQPQPFQIRNSNVHSLAVQVVRAGGTPKILPVARDDWESTRSLIVRGLELDLLLLTGGVSAGKYDIVKRVVAELGAEFFFDRVLIQPGQPLVFGRARGKFFFGLPGNPVSTMITFELFGRAAVEMLGGRRELALPLLSTRLARDFRHKSGLTRFLPARLSADGSSLTPVPWKGSSDVAAVARANAFLVAGADHESWQAGDWIRVLPK